VDAEPDNDVEDVEQREISASDCSPMFSPSTASLPSAGSSGALAVHPASGRRRRGTREVVPIG
jgi:hypothetical protein